MRYEELSQTHLPALAKMYAEAFNAPPWNDQWTDETASRRLSLMVKSEGFYGLVCFGDGVLCGMILGDLDPFYNGDQLYIREFCVALPLRGTGIGSMLLEEFERRLLAQGITKTYLVTSRTDDTEAFYRKRGYGSWDGMVMMGKRLDA